MSLSLQTPNITACQPATFQWSGGVAPYGLYLATDVNSTSLGQYGMEFDRVNSTGFVARTFFPAGSVVWATLYGNMSTDGSINPYGTKLEGQGPFHVGGDGFQLDCDAVYSSKGLSTSASSGSSSNITLVGAKLSPQQCQNTTIAWTGGKAPYKLLFQTNTPRTTFNSAISFTNVSGQDLTTKIPFAKDETFNIYISSALGSGQLVTSTALTVGDSNDASCLFNASPSSSTSTSTTSTSSSSTFIPFPTAAALSKPQLSHTARIGLAVGLAVFASLLIVAMGFYLRIRRRQMKNLRPRPLDSPDVSLNRSHRSHRLFTPAPMVENRRRETQKQIDTHPALPNASSKPTLLTAISQRTSISLNPFSTSRQRHVPVIRTDHLEPYTFAFDIPRSAGGGGSNSRNSDSHSSSTGRPLPVYEPILSPLSGKQMSDQCPIGEAPRHPISEYNDEDGDDQVRGNDGKYRWSAKLSNIGRWGSIGSASSRSANAKRSVSDSGHTTERRVKRMESLNEEDSRGSDFSKRTGGNGRGGSTSGHGHGSQGIRTVDSSRSQGALRSWKSNSNLGGNGNLAGRVYYGQDPPNYADVTNHSFGTVGR